MFKPSPNYDGTLLGLWICGQEDADTMAVGDTRAFWMDTLGYLSDTVVKVKLGKLFWISKPL